MDAFNIHRGVKQGCPLSAALCIVISLLLHKIKNGQRIKDVRPSAGKMTKITAYADVTVFIKDQTELEDMNKIFKMYEEISGARLNQNKVEAV